MTFQRVYDHIIGKVPYLAANCRDPRIIFEWIESGYDVDKDIIPAVDFVCKKGTASIKGFGWFTGAIKWSHQKRITDAAKPKEATRSEKEELRAKSIRWHRDKGLYTTNIGPQDYAWLAQYEKENQSTAM